MIKRKKITIETTAMLPSSTIKDNAIRQLREPLLKAFDIYKSNIYYGIVTETIEEHENILRWYKDLCDLNINAIENVPALIKKYV